MGGPADQRKGTAPFAFNAALVASTSLDQPRREARHLVDFEICRLFHARAAPIGWRLSGLERAGGVFLQLEE